MSIKRRNAIPYDDYSALDQENVSEDDISRALKHFMRHVEDKKTVHPDLLKFIAKWIRKTYELGNINPWKIKLKGRPGSKCSNNFLYMLAWYRAYLDPEFCEIPRNDNSDGKGDGYQQIANSFNKENLQSLHAANLEGGQDDLRMIDSPISIKRAIREFTENGLVIPGLFGADIHNENQLESFCRIVLRLSEKEKINALKKKIMERWVMLNKKIKDQ